MLGVDGTPALRRRARQFHAAGETRVEEICAPGAFPLPARPFGTGCAAPQTERPEWRQDRLGLGKTKTRHH